MLSGVNSIEAALMKERESKTVLAIPNSFMRDKKRDTNTNNKKYFCLKKLINRFVYFWPIKQWVQDDDKMSITAISLSAYLRRKKT
jgi:hypothetical protein